MTKTSARHILKLKDVLEACEDGQLSKLQVWKAQAARFPNLMKRDILGRCPHEYAAANGHLSVIKWLASESDQEIDLAAKQNLAFRLAARCGNFECAKWLLEDSGQAIDFTDMNHSAFYLTAINGHLPVLNWLATKYAASAPSREVLVKTFQKAAENGQLEVLKWLEANYLQVFREQSTRAESCFIQTVAKRGNLDIVTWLFRDSQQHFLIFDAAADLLVAAVNSRDLEVVKWLVQDAHHVTAKNPSWHGQKCMDIDIQRDALAAIKAAAAAGLEDITKFLLTVQGPIDISTDNFVAAQRAAWNGHLELAFWLRDYIQADGFEFVLQLRLEELSLATLQRCAVTCYGTDPLNFSTFSELINTLEKQPDCYTQLRVLDKILDKAGVDVALSSRKVFYCSASLRTALASGLVMTMADIKKVLHASENADTRQASRRL